MHLEGLDKEETIEFLTRLFPFPHEGGKKVLFGPPHKQRCECRACNLWFLGNGVEGLKYMKEENWRDHEMRQRRGQQAAWLTALWSVGGLDLASEEFKLEAGIAIRGHCKMKPKRKWNVYSTLRNGSSFKEAVAMYANVFLQELGYDPKEIGKKVVSRAIRLAAPEEDEEELMTTDAGKLDALERLANLVNVDFSPIRAHARLKGNARNDDIEDVEFEFVMPELPQNTQNGKEDSEDE